MPNLPSLASRDRGAYTWAVAQRPALAEVRVVVPFQVVPVTWASLAGRVGVFQRPQGFGAIVRGRICRVSGQRRGKAIWDQVGQFYAYHGDVPAEVRLRKLTEGSAIRSSHQRVSQSARLRYPPGLPDAHDARFRVSARVSLRYLHR